MRRRDGGQRLRRERAARADRHGLARRHEAPRRADPAVQASAVYIVLDDGTRVDAQRARLRPLRGHGAGAGRSDGPRAAARCALGRARALRVGDPVAVIGSPFENRASLSTGVVSQLDRQIAAPGVCFRDDRRRSRRTRRSTRATPAARCSTPTGRVVGHGARRSTCEARGGVAYAVPIEAVARGLPRRSPAGGTSRYAWLGVSAATLTPPLADSRSTSRVEHGALVPEPDAGRRGGARRPAGRHRDRSRSPGRPIRRDGDIIVAVGATPVAGFRDLDRAIAGHRAGETVDLHVVRHGRRHASCRRACWPRPASFAGLQLTAHARCRTRDTIASRRGHRPQEGGRVASDQRDGRGRWPTRS